MPVHDVRGRLVGSVTRGVFHAGEPRLVGVEVRLRRWFGLIDRPRRYVAFENLSIGAKAVELHTGARLEREGARRTTHDWEQSVVWTGQPVLTECGVELGRVVDAVFDGEGRVIELELTGGPTRDIAVGRRTIDGSLADRFDGAAVRVSERALEAEFTGGVAAGAGRGVAATKSVIEQAAAAAAKGAVKVAVTAVESAKRARVPERTGGMWSGFVDGIKEGMRDDDREEKR